MATETESKTDSKPEIQDKPEIQFNERTLEAFEKENLDIPHGVIAEKERRKAEKAAEKQPVSIPMTKKHATN